MRQIYLLLACVMPLLCACEFSPTGDYFEEINPKPVNNISIDLNSASDTIFARGALSLVLRLELPGKHLRNFKMLLNGKVIREGNQPYIHINLNTDQYPDGPHELKVLVESNTGTNSMADKGGYEYMQVFRNWVLMLDNAPFTPVKITKLAVEAGTVQLEWEKYQRRQFSHFVVSRRHTSGSVMYSQILPPDATTFTDHSFMGGTGYYSVDVAGSGINANGQIASVTYDAPKLLSYKYVNGNVLQLTFSASKLYQNFGKYRIVAAEDQEMTYETSNLSDTVVNLHNVPFGTDFNLLLTTVPKEPEYSEYGTQVWFTVNGYGKANSTGAYQISHYSPQHNLLYDFHNATISALDPQTLQLKQTRYFPMSYSRTLSTNGRYLYSYEHEGILLQLNPVTFETVARYDLRELLPGISSSEVLLQVANNNKLLVYARNYSDDDNFYVVDMNTLRQELKHTQSAGNPSSVTISPDGKMVTAFDFVFRLQQNGTWLEKQVAPYAFNTILYHPTAPLYLIGGHSTVTFTAQRMMQL